MSALNIGLIAITIMFLGPLLEQIPCVILSAIIVVSLKKIFMQVRQFRNFWAISKIDGVSYSSDLAVLFTRIESEPVG